MAYGGGVWVRDVGVGVGVGIGVGVGVGVGTAVIVGVGARVSLGVGVTVLVLALQLMHAVTHASNSNTVNAILSFFINPPVNFIYVLLISMFHRHKMPLSL